jgi:hypothetical protein
VQCVYDVPALHEIFIMYVLRPPQVNARSQERNSGGQFTEHSHSRKGVVKEYKSTDRETLVFYKNTFFRDLMTGIKVVSSEDEILKRMLIKCEKS